MERDWKEAKPKWIVDAAKAEMKVMRNRLALRWPDEARPVPVPFKWGDYDRFTGNPEPGVYFTALSGSVLRVEIRAKTEDDKGYRPWLFKHGNVWTDKPFRGSLYETERDANLAMLWAACDKAAMELAPLWDAVQKDRGFL